MSKSEGRLKLNSNIRVLLLGVISAVIIYLIVRNITVFGSVLVVLLGFGAVIMVHEFGHFIVAKLAGIKVEAFSIGISPVVAGIMRTEQGWRIRILPQLLPKENDESGDGRLTFTIGKKASPGETEYRIGLIPFGGFVKMLGQEDTKTVEKNDDPRSYANKPVGARMAVIAAGVIFNIISAVIVFMMVFLVGINRTPAVIGGIVPGSPAARAGLQAGDEVIEIDGESDNLEFSDILTAAALSGKNKEVELKVRRRDGSVADFGLVAERMTTQMGKVRLFGIFPFPPRSLVVDNVADTNELLQRTSLLPGDHIVAINGSEVEKYWQLEEIIRKTIVQEVSILAQREGRLVESRIRLDMNPANKEVSSESDLGHIYSMVPRLRIAAVSPEPASIGDKLTSLLDRKKTDETKPCLQVGDIIVAIGDVQNPTYKEVRDITTEYEDKQLPIKVLRTGSNGSESTLTVTVMPKRQPGSDRVVIGIVLVLDAEHPVVAKTIDVEDGPARLAIPRGASITAVDGKPVSSFYDIIRQIKQSAGQRINIDWRVDEEIAGDVAFDAGTGQDNFITVESTPAESIPLKPLEKLYKASGPIDAVVMGGKRTIGFLAQAYVTLQRALSGLVSPKSFIGPVGIVSFSYKIVSQKPLIYYAYFLGLISAFIAVFNFLPMLPFDGGHIVFLLIEKIKGSPVSEQVQSFATYVGLVLVGMLALYVTFNDIIRSFFS